MSRTHAFFIGSLLSMTLAAQQGLLRLTVLDSADPSPIAGVHLLLPSGAVVGTTNARGICTLEMDRIQGPLTLSHVSYEKLRLDIEPGHENMIVRLVRRSHDLPAVDIGLPRPERVLGLDGLHVATFRIGAGGIWVLGYVRPRLLRTERMAGAELLRDAVLCLMDTGFAELDRIAVPGDAVALHAGMEGRVHLETATNAFACGRVHGAVRLEEVGLGALREAILPWTDTIPGRLLGSNADGSFPAFDHLAYDPERGEATIVCSIVDRPLMELFRSQYKYMKGPDKVVAMNLAERLGVDKEIIAGYMTDFPRDIYFHAPYAPLFVVGDTLFVFDHYQARIRKFTQDLRPAGSAIIAYQRERSWDELILQDQRTRRLYLVGHAGPSKWLQEIDPHTGRTRQRQVIAQHHPENIQVDDGYAYYVYRATGTLDRKALYREQLR